MTILSKSIVRTKALLLASFFFGFLFTNYQAEASAPPVSVLLTLYDEDDLRGPELDRLESYYLANVNQSTKNVEILEFPQTMAVDPWDPNSLSEIFQESSASGVKRFLSNWYAIDHYLTLNLEGIAQIVDLMEDTTITPTATFSYGGYDFIEDLETPVSGAGLLAYTRYQEDGRYQRQNRQLEALAIVSTGLQNVNLFTNSLSLHKIIQSHVETDMGIWDVLKHLKDYLNHRISEEWTMDHYVFEGDSMEFDGYPYVIVDEEDLISHNTQ